MHDWERSRENALKQKLSYSNVSPKEQMLSHAKFESYEHCTATEIAPCSIDCPNEINVFIGKIDCMARMFRHGGMLLSPQARMIVQHRDGTRRGNSAFPFHFVFRIRSCVFSFSEHISSWSRTLDTNLIRGLSHG